MKTHQLVLDFKKVGNKQKGNEFDVERFEGFEGVEGVEGAGGLKHAWKIQSVLYWTEQGGYCRDQGLIDP